MLYHAYEFSHALLHPWHRASEIGEALFDSPQSPWSYVPAFRALGASCRVFNHLTHRYSKPEFGITQTMVQAVPTPVAQVTVLSKPFCDLIRFKRDEAVCGKRDDPKVLIVAPMSGHFATLLRDTVTTMLPEHDTYVTDWRDAREVPVLLGGFDLDDYIQYVIDFIRELGPNTHVIAVCQPAVPVLAAAAVMAQMDDPCTPASLTLMGGPIDPRRNPTAVNEHAAAHDLDWCRNHVISYVPLPSVGAMQRVYPGFLQLSGFMSMNMGRHVTAYRDYFLNLVAGDSDSAAQHKRFYDEYLSVMDLPAEFFLDTVDRVFQRYDLAQGTFDFKGHRVDCGALKKTTLMTVEGELDDICAVGQTQAAHDLCVNIADQDHYHYEQPGVGHFGVFNGTRWRTEIQPRIREMIRSTELKQRKTLKQRASAKTKTRAKAR
ncbi:MAG: poly(3-hydroxybutyrate) depolymerase [Gammaproteobacteria bacterium]|jgi:poly(3-hydroxybutyrate) depolymerase